MQQDTTGGTYKGFITIFYNPVSEELDIKRKLFELGNVRVFSRSSEVMQYYRDRTKDITR